MRYISLGNLRPGVFGEVTAAKEDCYKFCD